MIVPLKHLDLVCVGHEAEATLAALQDAAVVHLDLSAASGAEVAELRGELADVERMIWTIRRAREGLDEQDRRPRSLAELEAIVTDRETLRGERERLEREIQRLAPYGDFDPALAQRLLDRGIDLKRVADLPSPLPEMRLGKLREKLARVENRIAIDTAKLAVADEDELIGRFPGLKDRLAFAAAKERLSHSGALASISGWVSVRRVDALRRLAAERGWGILLRDPTADETPPTLIEPPRFFRSVKALFEGLGIAPAYAETDVSVPFMCYFSLFFAMLVGDGAYGVIFLVATLVLRRKLPRSWFVLMTVFSSATILWGFLSNTWFGTGLPGCGNLPTARWLAGADAPAGREYDNMMLLCFTIGVSHLMLARLWNGICRLNSRACLSDFGWAGIVLFMYMLTNSIVGIFNGIPTWAYWMFGFSFLTIFIQAKGMDKGMLFLNVMSVLGDIISYVRLFAVGLASVKVAENFNGMAVGMGLPIWIKWLPLALILFVGHALNLAMAGLSVLVHAVRLNTLEFSNHKGISWAGYAFQAFGKVKQN